MRLAVCAISEHLTAKTQHPTVLVGYDTRFYSEEFSALAVQVLQEHGIKTLLCETFTPTPAIAYEIRRRKLDGGINFTASHNPAQYHGLKFSGSDAGPALPEVTKDIEARVAKIIANGTATSKSQGTRKDVGERVNLKADYLKRIEELVRFDTIRSANLKVVADALHGAGAGYLDKVLIDHGIAVEARRVNRDCLFDGGGPDVSEENLASLGKAVKDSGSKIGLATDGDADRFGIVDADGSWIQPNLILALVYDYIVETRGWKLPAARRVATTQMIDAAAKSHGQTTYQTPVGFKYIGQLIREDKIALGGEERRGAHDSRPHPRKRWHSGMSARRGDDRRPSGLDRRTGARHVQEAGPGISPCTENLHLTDEQKANTIKRVAVDSSTLLGRKVVSVDRTDGAKFVFEDGSWMLLRLSGTEPLLRLYVEAESAAATKKLVHEASDWVLKGA